MASPSPADPLPETPDDELIRPAGDPDLTGLDPSLARRVQLTVSCRDTDRLAKVPGAGDVLSLAGERVQRMHNGLLIAEGCYYGPWMTEIIRGLRGHHEPQEEVVFAEVIRRLRASRPDSQPAIIEFGSFWAYYSMWFLREFPAGRAICIEPDAAYLEVGRANFALNGLVGEFHLGAVGAAPGELMSFVQESDGCTAEVVQYDLDSALATAGLAHLDLLMVDIQGAETVLLERAMPSLSQGRVSYIIVSTHHHSISGSALTHQRALQLIADCGGVVISEHSVGESFSGDGLIAVGFPQVGADCRAIPVSYARARDSLFGELEHDLEQARVELGALKARVAADEAASAATHASLAKAQSEVANLSDRLRRLEEAQDSQWLSRTRRLGHQLRSAGARVRQSGGRQG